MSRHVTGFLLFMLCFMLQILSHMLTLYNIMFICIYEPVRYLTSYLYCLFFLLLVYFMRLLSPFVGR